MKASLVLTLWTVFASALAVSTSAVGEAIAPSHIEWQRSYPFDSSWDRQPCLARTADGGYILGAQTDPGLNPVGFGDFDYRVLRLNARGDKLWDALFGGWSEDYLWAVQQTSDGGFILAGESGSWPSGNRTAPRLDGYSDLWIVRLDSGGNQLWDKAFGGRRFAGDRYEPRAVLEAANGDLLIAGSVSYDFWILRLNPLGEKLWERSYGGLNEDFLTDAIPLPDQGYLLAGHSLSAAGGTKTTTNYGGYDVWLVRIDAAGNPLWERSYGGTSNDTEPRVIQTADGGFAVGARTASGIGGNKTTPYFGQVWEDYWVLRLDGSGDKIWEQTFGGPHLDWLTDLYQPLDGGLILAGFSSSDAGGNKTAPLLSRYDLWLVRLDQSGARVWEQTYDGSKNLGPPCLQGTPDGGATIATTTVGDPSDPGTSDLALYKFSVDALTAPRLRFPSLPPPGGAFRFQVWGISNRTYVTEFSSDLRMWSPLATNQLGAEAAEIVDGAAGGAQRFYRARMVE